MKQVKNYLTLDERKSAVKEVGDNALILYEHYIRTGTPDYHFTDDKNAYVIGWSTAKAKRIRLLLEKHGYLYTEIFVNRKAGNKLIKTHIGIENVKKAKGE